MKPVNLNQLLFHPPTDCLSFFESPLLNPNNNFSHEAFFEDMEAQLKIQKKFKLAKILSKNKEHIKKIRASHPDRSHGYFLSEDRVGYIILDQTLEPYCHIGQNFHVRPLLEEFFVNPEFILINVSLYDVKIYRGDFKHLEIIQQYDFDELPKNFFANSARVFAPQYLGLIPYKTILALKTIAQKTMDFILYQSLPVIVTGLSEIKEIFLRYFKIGSGIISHVQEDFYEKTCVEILNRSKVFRSIVVDYYSSQLKERLKRMVKSKNLISDLGDIIKATYKGKVRHLVLPREQILWGKINFETLEYVIHKKVTKNSVDIFNELAEEVIRQGGNIQVLGPHFFPQDANLLAVLRGGP